MAEEFVYCYRGDHHVLKRRMLGNACVECRAKQATEDAPSLAVVAARAVWGEKKLAGSGGKAVHSKAWQHGD